MFVTVTTTAHAQRIPADTSSAAIVGAAFLDAVAAAKWSDAARLLDFAPLDSLRKLRAGAARSMRASHLTVERLMRMNPDMPRAVAIDQVKRHAKQSRGESILSREFGVDDPDSLLRMPMNAVAQRWLMVHDERWQERELARICKERTPSDSAPRFRVIGTVVDDSVAYVLYDRGETHSAMADALNPLPAKVMFLRRAPDGWSILPRADLIGLPPMVVACG